MGKVLRVCSILCEHMHFYRPVKGLGRKAIVLVDTKKGEIKTEGHSLCNSPLNYIFVHVFALLSNLDFSLKPEAY